MKTSFIVFIILIFLLIGLTVSFIKTNKSKTYIKKKQFQNLGYIERQPTVPNLLISSEWALSRTKKIGCDIWNMVSTPLSYTVEFSMSKFKGKDMCNNIEGIYQVKDDKNIKFDSVFKSEMLCTGNAEANLKYVFDSTIGYSLILPKYNWESKELQLNTHYEIFSFYEIKNGILNNISKDYSSIIVDSEKEIQTTFMDIFEGNLDTKIRMVNLSQIHGHTVPFASILIFELLPKIVYGRPLTDNNNHLLPTISDSYMSDWSEYKLSKELETELYNLTVTEKKQWSTKWKEMAQKEYSSIASFAVLLLNLSKHGFPKSLINKIPKLITDEIRHATIFLSLASCLDGTPFEFKNFPWTVTYASTLAKLTEDNNRDGVVNEYNSAVQLKRDADIIQTQLPAYSDLLREISDDEFTHAKFAQEVQQYISSH